MSTNLSGDLEQQDAVRTTHTSSDFLNTRCNLILHQRMLSDVKQSISQVKKKVHETELTLNMRPPEIDEHEMELWNTKVDALVNHKMSIPFPKFRDIKKEIRQENEELLRKIRKEKEDHRLLLLPGRMRYNASLNSVRTSKQEFKEEVADKMKNINFGEPIKGDIIKVIENYNGANCMLQGTTRTLVRKSRVKDTFVVDSGLPSWMGVGYYINTDPSYLKDKSEKRYIMPFIDHDHKTSAEHREEKLRETEKKKKYRSPTKLQPFMATSVCSRPHSREDFLDQEHLSPWSRQSGKSSIGLTSPLSSRGCSPLRAIVGARSISRDKSAKINNQFRERQYDLNNEFNPNFDDESHRSKNSKNSRQSSKSSVSTIIQRQTPEPPKLTGKSYLHDKTFEGKNAMKEQTTYEPWRRDYTLGALALQSSKPRTSSAKRRDNGRSRPEFDDGRGDDRFVPDDKETKKRDDDDSSLASSEVSEMSLGDKSHGGSSRSVTSERSFHKEFTKDFVNHQAHINRRDGFMTSKKDRISKTQKLYSGMEYGGFMSAPQLDVTTTSVLFDSTVADADIPVTADNGNFATITTENIGGDEGVSAVSPDLAVRPSSAQEKLLFVPRPSEMLIKAPVVNVYSSTGNSDDKNAAAAVVLSAAELESGLPTVERARRDAKLSVVKLGPRGTLSGYFPGRDGAAGAGAGAGSGAGAGAVEKEEIFTGDIKELFEKGVCLTQTQKSLKKQSDNKIRKPGKEQLPPPKSIVITASDPPLHENINKHLSRWYVENDIYLPEKPKCLEYRNFKNSAKDVNLNGLLLDEQDVNERVFKLAMSDENILAEIEKNSDITHLMKKKKKVLYLKPSVITFDNNDDESVVALDLDRDDDHDDDDHGNDHHAHVDLGYGGFETESLGTDLSTYATNEASISAVYIMGGVTSA